MEVALAQNHFGMALLGVVLMILVSYQGLDLVVRISASEHRAHRVLWLMLSPIAGLGMWAVDFVSVLSWLHQPMSHFNPLWSLAAYPAATLLCFGVLVLGSIERPRAGLVAAGLLLLSADAVLMYFLNLASVNVDIFRDLGATELALTVLCDIVALTFSVCIIRRGRHPRRERWFVRRLVSAVAMGAVAALSLQIALGATLVPLRMPVIADTYSSVLWLGGTAGVGALLLLLTVVVLSHHCTRMYLRAQRFSGSINQLNSQLVHLATHDALTGLPNRQTLTVQMEQWLEDVRAETGGFAIFYIDLDGFKTINDTYGHRFGDEVLSQAAERLQVFFSGGSLARVGGDEFVGLLEQGAGRRDAPGVAAQMIEALRQDMRFDDTDVQITASIGISVYPADGEDVEELIANADVAMYEAKAQGRNQHCSHDGALKSRALRVLQIQRGLQSATQDGSLTLHYQPKHDCRTGEILGAEALARWQHPQLGAVSPAEFIGVAERSGQILALGEWVIAQACLQLRQWRDDGLTTLRIAINLSPLQLNQPDLLDRAAALVQAEGLDPSQIMFEITESMAMQNAERTIAVLRAFRARGFEFAIDDFGTGYSSLAYLQKFQVRQLKIDRYFINALDEGGHEAYAIITAIIALAHTLGMEVVAEGVESANQAGHLRTLGCDQIQGYLLSRPMPPDQFALACLDAPVKERRSRLASR